MTAASGVVNMGGQGSQMGGGGAKFWEQLKSRELPSAVFEKLKGSIERRKR